jgi:Bacterial SH3 domain
LVLTKRSLAWLWLFGVVLYAASTWLGADMAPDNAAPAPGLTSISPKATIDPGSIQKTAPQTDAAVTKPSSTPQQSFPDHALEANLEGAVETASMPVERLVVRSTANIRDGPSSKHAVVGKATVGAELAVAERQGGWVRFVDTATSNTGWIYQGLLAPLETIPAAEEPEATTISKRPDAAKTKRHGRDDPGGLASPAAIKQPSTHASRAEYRELPPDETFRPRNRRFGLFARRKMLREGLLGQR